MYKHLLIIVGLVLISKLAYSQYRLEVEVVDLRNEKGFVMMQLFDRNEKIIAQEKMNIQDKKCLVVFSDLKPGEYAVRFYHDENLSGKMETNIYGKPVEGYGFSNNVVGKFGPPPFEKWLFDLNRDKKISLKTVY